MRHQVSVLAAGVVAVLACALLLYRCGTADVADDEPSAPFVSRAPGDGPRDIGALEGGLIYGDAFESGSTGWWSLVLP